MLLLKLLIGEIKTDTNEPRVMKNRDIKSFFIADINPRTVWDIHSKKNL